MQPLLDSDELTYCNTKSTILNRKEMLHCRINGMTVLWTYVPPMSQLCYCNKRVYDRNDDADQDVTDKNDRVAESAYLSDGNRPGFRKYKAGGYS